MVARYKIVSVGGKNFQEHRLVWEENFGKIPEGCVVHHIDGDRKNNNIDNLAIMASGAHTRLHNLGVEPWNKGIKYGLTEAYKKANKNRKENYLKICKIAYEMYEYEGVKQHDIAKKMGVSRRQICDRLRTYRTFLKTNDQFSK